MRNNHEQMWMYEDTFLLAKNGGELYILAR